MGKLLYDCLRRSRRIGLFAVLLMLLLPAIPAQFVQAATITVDSLGDGAATVANCTIGHAAGTCRLRDAIAAANANDTITFSVSGSVTLTSGTLMIAQNMTIDGTGHAVVVDGGCTAGCGTTSAVGGVSVFQVNSGVTATIMALTIQHGNASVTCTTLISSLCGGGIANNGALTVKGLTVSTSSAQAGGGIFNGGTLTVAGASVISGNATPGGFGHGGGGIWSNPTTSLTVADSTISNNTSSFTGGGVTNYGAMTMTNSIVSGNSAVVGGSAIDSESAGTILTVTNSAFISNTNSGSSGGALYFLGATLTVASSTFVGNTFFGVFAGINNSGMVTNSTLSGSGIYNGNGTLVVTNSTVSSTIQADGGTVALTNTIVSGSCSKINAGVITNGGHNLQFNGTSCGATIPNTDPKLGTLADNGGTTPLPDGSHIKTFALLTGSPAIDMGDDTVCTQTGTGKVNMMDERGISRPQGTHCDIGAYEFQVSPPNPLPPRDLGGGTGGIVYPLPTPTRPVGAPQNGAVNLLPPRRP